MPTAREILDERLARGEITAQEHEALAARLGSGAGSTTSAAMPSLKLSKGGVATNIFGIVGALVWAGLTSNVVTDMIETCVRGGASAAACRTSAVNWPIVYGSYGIALLVGGFSIAALVISKRAGSTGSAAR